jgi:hypothetical protein
MRLNRFLAMLGLAVAAGIGLVGVEGQNLRLEQKLTELHHQRDRLVEQQARLRAQLSRLTAPARVLESLSQSELELHEPPVPTASGPRANTPVYLQR